MKYKFFFASYKLFEYEMDFARREIQSLVAKFNGELVAETSQYIEANIECLEVESLKSSFFRLTYVSKIDVEVDSKFELFVEPKQALFEKSCLKTGSHKRQSTRYGAHGLHEYKGKFNPQIVSAIARHFNLDESHRVLEPFCGSGTTLYQCELMGIRASGFDFNPLAVYLANTKLLTLSIDADDALSEITILTNSARTAFENGFEINIRDERTEYLNKWFDINQLGKIEALKFVIESANVNAVYKDICFCLASDLIRSYSLQEPADLRIRRRKTPLPEKCFFDALIDKVNDLLLMVKSISSCVDLGAVESKSYNIDIRDSERLSDFTLYDAAITSPPYATALPYIDTQRLSIIWLGMATPKQVKAMENALIGSRELTKSEERLLKNELESNQGNLPDVLHSLCMDMLNSLSESDGFRRQAMPFVVYRYFRDMKIMFENVSKMIKKGGEFGLVVGHNQTTLGGRLFMLDTPSYLARLAEGVGWDHIDSISLDVYKRYDLHKANSISSETLVVLKNR